MMRSVPCLRFASLFVLPILLSNCAYGPWPYGGYGGQPYGYPQPTYQGGYPGYQTYPQGTIVPNGSVTPGGVYPQSNINGGGLQPLQDAQSWEGANKPVPDPTNSQGSQYYDQSSALPRNSQESLTTGQIVPATLNNAAPLQPISRPDPQTFAPEPQTFAPEPTTQYSPVPVQQNPMTDAIDVNDSSFEGFQAPVINSGSDLGQPFPDDQKQPELPASPQPFTFQKVPTPAVSVFDHEPEYRWIRGVVSRDATTGIWSVVYADSPNQDDQYAGHLSLDNSPALEELKDGEIVQVSGQLEPVRKDPLGKPYFLVTSVKKISQSP